MKNFPTLLDGEFMFVVGERGWGLPLDIECTGKGATAFWILDWFSPCPTLPVRIVQIFMKI